MLTTLEQLETLYGLPHERAVRKEIPFLNEDYQAMVRASPLVVVSSSGPEGIDGSPRGDVPGFVRIMDERTLAIPDRPGGANSSWPGKPASPARSRRVPAISSSPMPGTFMPCRACLSTASTRPTRRRGLCSRACLSCSGTEGGGSMSAEP